MGEPLLNVSFYGTRGSTPCPSEDNRRYGGNTSCVALESPGHDPIVLDLGTGLRFFGETQPRDGTFRGAALVTHLHWDHVQGLPFFTPVLCPGAQFDIYGPPQAGGTLSDAFHRFICPPFFPVTVEQLYGQMTFYDAGDTDLVLDGAKVRVRPVPHVGANNGYRVELGGASVAYLSDHQMPQDGTHSVSEDVLELCDGVDVLIHDAQHTAHEYETKRHFGHSTIDYAVHVAREAGVKTLVLFHHCPSHGDTAVDEILDYARDLSAETNGPEVTAAHEGMRIDLAATT
jgi:phosphoribosyl 1,2-cyclic phosphodiesterase